MPESLAILSRLSSDYKDDVYGVFNLRTVNYMSVKLDAEELPVLQTIPWDKVCLNHRTRPKPR